MTRVRCALAESARSERKRRQEEAAEFFRTFSQVVRRESAKLRTLVRFQQGAKKIKNKFIFFLHAPMGVLP